MTAVRKLNTADARRPEGVGRGRPASIDARMNVEAWGILRLPRLKIGRVSVYRALEGAYTEQRPS
jgi:hypothetical protein